MSAKATFWAWEQAAVTGNNKLVLLCYAQYANDDGCAWPGKTTIARQCGLGETTVKRCVRWLMDNGYMSQVGEGMTQTEDGKRRSTSRYRLLFDAKPSRQGGTKNQSNHGQNEPGSNRTRFKSDPVQNEPTPDSSGAKMNPVQNEPGSNDTPTGSKLAPNTINKHKPNNLKNNNQKTDSKPKPVRDRKTKTPKPRSGELDFSKWPELPSEQVWADYKKLRQAKQAPLTQTSIDSMGRELTILTSHGITVDRALAVCLDRGWRGLRAEWVINDITSSNPSGGSYAARQQACKQTPADAIRQQAEQHLRELDEREAMERQNGTPGCSPVGSHGAAVPPQMDDGRGRDADGKWPDEREF